ncbi:MAG: phosphoenolpyruvate carboxykinase (ATP), partial [Gammaproteobacteria bacterium]
MQSFSLESYGITVDRVLRNTSPALLYEEALRNEPGTAVSSTGALIALSGAKTGRSPKDKRVVGHEQVLDDVWWGDVNVNLEERVFEIARRSAVDYLSTRDQLYVVDGFAGWDE